MVFNNAPPGLANDSFAKAPISPLQRYDFILNCEKINTKFFKLFSNSYISCTYMCLRRS